MSEINPYGLSSKDYAKLYNSWKNMISRCYDERSQRYYTYGERGIRVCDDWLNDCHAFIRFALTNGWRPGLSIERIDVDGDYCPENCTFITMAEQMRNKTSNVYITIAGETKCLTEWCEIFNVSAKTVFARYYSGVRDVDTLFYKGDLRTRCKIVQLSCDGEIVKEYARAIDAERETGISASAIRNACRRKGRAGAYRWRKEVFASD